MITKTVTYTDYNGVERTEDFYFHLSLAELAEMEASNDGSLSDVLEKISKEKNIKKMTTIFKEILLKSYGVKSEDGKRFIKNQETLDSFVQSPAYSIIFMELATNDKKAAEYIKGILPKEIDDLSLTEKQKSAKQALKNASN